MTALTRITISLPSDLEAAINEVKANPEFQRTPKSKIVCGLIRQGLEAQRPASQNADSELMEGGDQTEQEVENWENTLE